MFMPMKLTKIPKQFKRCRLAGVCVVVYRFKTDTPTISTTKDGAEIYAANEVEIIHWWSDGEYLASNSEAASEYPKLYKNANAALKRVESLKKDYPFEVGLALWLHDEYYQKPIVKYEELQNRFPGSPTN